MNKKEYTELREELDSIDERIAKLERPQRFKIGDKIKYHNICDGQGTEGEGVIIEKDWYTDVQYWNYKVFDCKKNKTTQIEDNGYSKIDLLSYNNISEQKFYKLCDKYNIPHTIDGDDLRFLLYKLYSKDKLIQLLNEILEK
jgi:hypothetical protein